MNYGLPYRGSKNKIAKRIVDMLPKATTLVDVFAGGCAITHAAMLSDKYQNYIANDIGDAPKLFVPRRQYTQQPTIRQLTLF